MGKGFEQTFLRRRQTKGHRHMKRCPASLVMRKMQIKSTTRHHCTTAGTSRLEQSDQNKCWPGLGEIRSLAHRWGEREMVPPLRKQPGSSSDDQTDSYPTQKLHCRVNSPEKRKHTSTANPARGVHGTITPRNQKVETTHVSPNR